jgi:hypothetical protein
MHNLSNEYEYLVVNHLKIPTEYHPSLHFYMKQLKVHTCHTFEFYLFKDKFKNTLFSLSMVTFSYERQDIIQFALKRLLGGT